MPALWGSPLLELQRTGTIPLRSCELASVVCQVKESWRL